MFLMKYNFQSIEIFERYRCKSSVCYNSYTSMTNFLLKHKSFSVSDCNFLSSIQNTVIFEIKDLEM